MTTRTDLLVLRRWRDGSVHSEAPYVVLVDDAGKLACHLDASNRSGSRFITGCGRGWFGQLSGSGYGDPARIDCEVCRTVLMGEPVASVGDDGFACCSRCGYSGSVVCADDVRACGDCGFEWPIQGVQGQRSDYIVQTDNTKREGS